MKIFFTYNYITNKDKAIENSKLAGDKEYEENLSNNIEYKFVGYEVELRDSKETVDRFNQLANRNFSEMVTIIVVIEKYQNDTLLNKIGKPIYVVKDGGKWSILRFNSEIQL